MKCVKCWWSVDSKVFMQVLIEHVSICVAKASEAHSIWNIFQKCLNLGVRQLNVGLEGAKKWLKGRFVVIPNTSLRTWILKYFLVSVISRVFPPCDLNLCGDVFRIMKTSDDQTETFSALLGILWGEFTGLRWIPRTKTSENVKYTIFLVKTWIGHPHCTPNC